MVSEPTSHSNVCTVRYTAIPRRYSQATSQALIACLHEFLHIRPFGVVEPAWKRSFFQRGLGLRKRKVREGGGCHEVDEAILERWNEFQ